MHAIANHVVGRQREDWRHTLSSKRLHLFKKWILSRRGVASLPLPTLAKRQALWTACCVHVRLAYRTGRCVGDVEPAVVVESWNPPTHRQHHHRRPPPSSRPPFCRARREKRGQEGFRRRRRRGRRPREPGRHRRHPRIEGSFRQGVAGTRRAMPLVPAGKSGAENRVLSVDDRRRGFVQPSRDGGERRLQCLMSLSPPPFLSLSPSLSLSFSRCLPSSCAIG